MLKWLSPFLFRWVCVAYACAVPALVFANVLVGAPHRVDENTIARRQPSIDYLNEKAPEARVRMVTLPLWDMDTHVQKNALNFISGFQMARRELRQQDVDPFPDFSALRFSGFPQERVVHAVSAEVVAGTFRSDSLEHLAHEGRLDWAVPLDYQPVHELMLELHIDPYRNFGNFTVSSLMEQYGPWLGLLLAAVFAVLGVALYVLHLNKVLRVTNDMLVKETEQSRALTEQLQYQALHDKLTGLPNRWAFDTSLKQALSRYKRQNDMFCLMVLDLDDFKRVNDVHGHYAGDSLLQQVAQRMAHVVRESDVFARMGGDEFAFIYFSVEAAAIEALVQRMLQVFTKPFDIDGKSLALTASVGIALHPENGTEASALMRSADMAMYHAKHTRSGFAFFRQVPSVLPHA